MSVNRSRRRNLPIWLRIILKIPEPNLGSFSDRFHGLFWVLILPVLFLSACFLNVFLIMGLLFPWNAVSFASFNSIVAVLMLRVLLGRTLESEEAVLNEGHFHWDMDQFLDEYVSFLDKRKRDQKTNSEFPQSN